MTKHFSRRTTKKDFEYLHGLTSSRKLDFTRNYSQKLGKFNLKEPRSLAVRLRRLEHRANNSRVESSKLSMAKKFSQWTTTEYFQWLHGFKQGQGI